MKSQEQVEKQFIRLLREQADRLEKGDVNDIIVYKPNTSLRGYFGF